jgi:hypothetical protein
MRQIMNKEPRQIEVVVDFVDRVHGTGFPEIRSWRPLFCDSCGNCGRWSWYRCFDIRSTLVKLDVKFNGFLSLFV